MYSAFLRRLRIRADKALTASGTPVLPTAEQRDFSSARQAVWFTDEAHLAEAVCKDHRTDTERRGRQRDETPEITDGHGPDFNVNPAAFEALLANQTGLKSRAPRFGKLTIQRLSGEVIPDNDDSNFLCTSGNFEQGLFRKAIRWSGNQRGWPRRQDRTG